MNMIYFFIIFEIILTIFFFMHIFSCTLNSRIELMNKLLEVDYKLYKECINNTNIIICGRKKSNILKHNKPPSKYRKKYILSLPPYKVISKSIKKCKEKDLLIIIGIGTGPEYFYERHVFRLHYGKYNFLSYFFFMGLSDNRNVNMKVLQESELYKDIVIFSFESSYYNLTTQIIFTFNWISSNCYNYKWYIHQTSDTYLNINKIYNFLIHYNECNCVIGNIQKNITVTQNRHNVFYIPFEFIKLKTYPDFPNGPGYFLHRNAIKELNKIIQRFNPKVWMDDVFIGLVISYTNITLININTLFHMRGTIYYSSINNYFLIHNLSPSEIYLLQKEIK